MRKSTSDEEILTALRDHNGIRVDAAKAVGLTIRRFHARVSALREKGENIGPSNFDPVAAISGTSTLFGAKGEVKLQWVKAKTEEQEREQRLHELAKALARSLPRLAPSVAPKATLAELCNVYTLTDCHVGMLAWGKETGADWDLAIAERVLTACFLKMIEAAPAAGVGIVNQLGDLLHFDSLVPETPSSRHILDADGRFPKVVEAAVRILRRIVGASLKKHGKTIVYMHEGNHDPSGSVWLRTLFAALYENEPRVVVSNTPEVYVAYQHGQVMIGFHHGHMAKNQSLPLLFAAKFPEVWGATSRGRYIHVGHRHHIDEKEHPGVNVIQHPTLAAPDAYAARGGWLSKRQASAITYHREFGEYGRNIVVPEMFA